MKYSRYRTPRVVGPGRDSDNDVRIELTAPEDRALARMRQRSRQRGEEAHRYGLDDDGVNQDGDRGELPGRDCSAPPKLKEGNAPLSPHSLR